MALAHCMQEVTPEVTKEFWNLKSFLKSDEVSLDCVIGFRLVNAKNS